MAEAVNITENFRYNNDQTITTDAGQFLVVQRNAGYADNDGHWVVSQLSELYWSAIGTLRRRRPGVLLGIFATVTEAETAITGAIPQPECDEMVL